MGRQELEWAVHFANCLCLLGAPRIDSPPLVRRVKFIYQEIGNDHSLAVVPTSIKQDHATRRHDGSPANVWRIDRVLKPTSAHAISLKLLG